MRDFSLVLDTSVKGKNSGREQIRKELIKGCYGLSMSPKGSGVGSLVLNVAVLGGGVEPLRGGALWGWGTELILLRGLLEKSKPGPSLSLATCPARSSLPLACASTVTPFAMM